MNQFVPDVQFELIAIKNLVSNQNYQRNLSMQHIQRMAANFDVYQINPVKVSRRDGQNLVMNGQHTIETVTLVSGTRDTPVWCMIYNGLQYQTEADIFASQQKYVKGLSPYEVFMAYIEADSDEHIIIRSIVESYGLTLAPRRESGAICAITTMEYIFRRHGFHVLDRTLRLCVIAWEGDPASLSANMINGVSRLVVAFGDTLKDDSFREKVGSFTPRDISRTARERRSGSLGYAEAMLTEYNKRRKDGLHMSRLYYTGRPREMSERKNPQMIFRRRSNWMNNETNVDKYSPLDELSGKALRIAAFCRSTITEDPPNIIQHLYETMSTFHKTGLPSAL